MPVTAVRTTPPLSTGLTLVENRVAVTPDNGNDLPYMAIKLYVGGAGNVKSEDFNGNATTWAATAGSYHYGWFKKVYATGTTATGIQAIY